MSKGQFSLVGDLFAMGWWLFLMLLFFFVFNLPGCGLSSVEQEIDEYIVDTAPIIKIDSDFLSLLRTPIVVEGEEKLIRDLAIDWSVKSISKDEADAIRLAIEKEMSRLSICGQLIIIRDNKQIFQDGKVIDACLDKTFLAQAAQGSVVTLATDNPEDPVEVILVVFLEQ